MGRDMNIRQRLNKLEARGTYGEVAVIISKLGESADEACKRWQAGHPNVHPVQTFLVQFVGTAWE